MARWILVALSLAWFLASVAFAQQPAPAPAPTPPPSVVAPPTCEQQLKDYTDNVPNWVRSMMMLETTAKTQAAQILQLTKERDDALAKGKDSDAAKEPAKAGTN
jgi:hypothetical protein